MNWWVPPFHLVCNFLRFLNCLISALCLLVHWHLLYLAFLFLPFPAPCKDLSCFLYWTAYKHAHRTVVLSYPFPPVDISDEPRLLLLLVCTTLSPIVLFWLFTSPSSLRASWPISSSVQCSGVHQENMGLQRKIKILAKRTIQEAQAVTLHPAKTKRPRSEEEEEAAASTPTALCGGGGLEGALHCPPAPKKPRLVMGCSLNGFKVLSVVDLRFFLRWSGS